MKTYLRDSIHSYLKNIIRETLPKGFKKIIWEDKNLFFFYSEKRWSESDWYKRSFKWGSGTPIGQKRCGDGGEEREG